ncbi:MAG: hypothetical protein ACRCTZ_08365 [Sarcina sp.]
MLIIKYKNKKIQGSNPIEFLLDEEKINIKDVEPYTYDIKLSEVDSIIVDGIELFKCPTVKF